MKQYKSIDLAKFVCAILIIVSHTAPLSGYSSALSFGLRSIITVIAVPFFFVASGFMTFKKVQSAESEQDRNAYIWKNLKRLILMYLLWSAVYFVFVLLDWILNGFTIYKALEYVKDFFFEGSYSTIWFLPALIVATAVVFLLSKKFGYKTIFLMAIPFYVFALLGSSYFYVTQQVGLLRGVFGIYYSFFDTIKNGLCFGFIYVAMGAWIAQKETSLINPTAKRFGCVVVIACWAMIAVEAFLIAYLGNNGVDTTVS